MGKFELAVLAAVLRLRDNAYGRRIHDDLEERLGKTVPMGQIYTALARMTDRGYLTAEVGEPTPVRGGRAKTFYQLTAAGERAYTHERDELRDLIGLLPAWKAVRS